MARVRFPRGNNRTAFMPARADFSDLSPFGHYVALRVRFTSPLNEKNNLPEAWVAEYTADGLMIFDPVMRWVYSCEGVTRWSELTLKDPQGVLVRAAAHRLHYGAAASIQDPDTGERSFGVFARDDREFADAELAALEAAVIDMHSSRARPKGLTRAECEALGFIRDGGRLKEIAHTLGITESAVKARIVSAKRKLGARTSVHAVALATEAGLI